MKIIQKLAILLQLTLMVSCQNKSEIESQRPDIKIYTVQYADAAVLSRIENIGEKSYFIPDEYYEFFLPSNDTVFNESIAKKEYLKEDKYYYDDFGENTVVMQEPIPGLKADSIKTEEHIIMYNTFSMPKLIELKPHSFLIRKQPNSAKCRNFIQFRFYRKKIDEKIINEPSYDSFINFEKLNSIVISTKIYQ